MTAVPPEAQPAVLAATQEATDALEWLQSNLPAITDAKQEEWAAGVLKQIGDQRIAADKQRKKLKAPVLKAGQEIDAFFRPAIQGYATAESYLKGLLQAYRNALREAQAAALKDAQSGPELAQAVAVLTPTPAGIQERTVRRLEIDADKLPREFMVPNETLIERALATGATVPGVKVVHERVVVKGR